MSIERTDPLWFKDAVLYEVHVRAFFDSSGDGIGDFRGLTQKLDYLQDLGVTAIWLLPFYPSPLKDDGYDIADYTGVHPSYGTLRDFRLFMREAHRRGLRVITELVLNHTSDQHPWFRRARKAPAGDPARDFYVWSDSPDLYKEARIIFKDFESSNWAFDAEANAYYWHRFYSHQPDLNFDNPAVHRAMKGVVDFWFDAGVDGMRLDAVPYLYERTGTSCENLHETHGFLQELRAHIEERFEDRMLLAEANQWPEEAVAYFGSGNECHMAFHFPLMPRMFMSVRMEDRFPLIDILQQTPEIPANCAWALFLRNHDELTLEMVTDEERDYMYRVYAHDPQMRINLGIRRRLAPLLGNNRRQIELMNGLLFSLPGTPVIYYGDEIGMGDNIYLGDRNGVRTPMQWSADRNAGFSRANPQRLYLPVIIDPEYHAEAINVEAQHQNPHSLLWWMRRLIGLRRRHPAFGRGTLEFLYPENRKVLAFLRRYGDEELLVVANLSRFSQFVELDLSASAGAVPLELFGHTDFPRIGDRPYVITLGPHAFYWFALQREPSGSIEVRSDQPVPTLRLGAVPANGSPGDLLERVVTVLPGYLRHRRWFRAKSRRIKSVEAQEVVSVPLDRGSAWLALFTVEYTDGDPQTYLLPLALASGEQAEELRAQRAHAVIATVTAGSEEMLLYDASVDERFASAMLDVALKRKRLRGQAGELTGTTVAAARRSDVALAPSAMRAEQTNTSIVFGDKLLLKLFRHLEEGENPDLELGRFLTQERRFANAPPVIGALEYRAGGRAPVTVGIVHRYVQNEGDGWSYTLDAVGAYLDESLTRATPPEPGQAWTRRMLRDAREGPPETAHELIGAYLEAARLLGQRTGELHITLASEIEDPAMAPEPFTPFYMRSLYQSMRALARHSFAAARAQAGENPAVASVLGVEEQVLERFSVLLDLPTTALRIRIHGDFHLGQVLWTGKDFVIIDFEGEPSRPLGTRRIKRSPLVDVAGMLRSFDYAANAAAAARSGEAAQRRAELQPWARFWTRWVSATFLQSYLDVARGHPFLPRSEGELESLLDTFLLEKAVYELGYEANNRPAWLPIPALAVAELLEAGDASG